MSSNLVVNRSVGHISQHRYSQKLCGNFLNNSFFGKTNIAQHYADFRLVL